MMEYDRLYDVFTVNGDRMLAMDNGELYMLDSISEEILQIGLPLKNEDLKRLYGKYSRSGVDKTMGEIDMIFSKKVKDHRNHRPPRKLRALCLNITHACNLSCTYCFAHELTAGPGDTMTVETVRRAIDFLMENSGGMGNLQVDFFGGEPLLAFEQVKDCVKYSRNLEKAKDRGINFTLTTNGVLLNDEVADFARDNSINLILSLDGPRQTNDRYRKTRAGKGSFDLIIGNILRTAGRLGKNDYYVRGTYTAESLNIRDTLEFYNDMGFYNVSLEPVTSERNKTYHIGPEHKDEILRQYEETALWMLGRDMQFYHFNLEVDNPLCLTRRITGCGAGVEYMAVDPKGDLYPCHQFVEDERFRLGNIRTGIERPDLVEMFAGQTLYDKEDCEKCWARFYCGGGCHFSHYKNTGSMKTPYKPACELFKGRLRVALWYNMKKKQREKQAIV